MGSILFNRISLIATLSEIIGYKSGLVLSSSDIFERLPKYQDLWGRENEDRLRVRSENFPEMVTQLLYSVGSIPSPNPLPQGQVEWVQASAKNPGWSAE